jgi:hypothetical protein
MADMSYQKTRKCDGVGVGADSLVAGAVEVVGAVCDARRVCYNGQVYGV